MNNILSTHMKKKKQRNQPRHAGLFIFSFIFPFKMEML
jgi:hypothetical protein